MDEITASEGNVADFFGSRFRANLEALAPIIPNYAVFHYNVFENVIGLSVSIHRLVNCRLYVTVVIAVEALDTDRIVKGTDKAIRNMNVHTVVHINSVGIVSPATNDFYVFYPEIFATNRANIINQRVANGDTVDYNVLAVFQLHGVLTYRVVYRCAVVFLVCFK